MRRGRDLAPVLQEQYQLGFHPLSRVKVLRFVSLEYIVVEEVVEEEEEEAVGGGIRDSYGVYARAGPCYNSWI